MVVGAAIANRHSGSWPARAVAPARTPTGASTVSPPIRAQRVRLGGFRWARRPRPGTHGRRPPLQASRAPSVRVAPLTCARGRVGALPTPGVALAAVPTLGARRFTTRPSPPGATQPAVVPTPHPQPFLASHGQTTQINARARSSAVSSGNVAWDQAVRDMSRTGATHGAIRLPKRRCSWGMAGAGRDHSQSRGTRPQRSRPERACPLVGDGCPRNPGGR